MTYGPEFNLAIVDAKTHVRLWTLVGPVDGAFRKATFEEESGRGHEPPDGRPEETKYSGGGPGGCVESSVRAGSRPHSIAQHAIEWGTPRSI